VERKEQLGQSAVQAYSEDSYINSAARSTSDIRRTMVASTTVVQDIAPVIDKHSNETSTIKQDIPSHVFSHTRTIKESTLENYCLEVRWEKRLKDLG
jgi:hypothetical protein